MIQVYPSILETNINIFKSRLQQYFTIFDYFQIDIADGQFVDNRTIQINDIAKLITYNAQIKKNTEKVSFEIHLMVKDWQNEIPKIEQLSKLINIKTILIHLLAFNAKYHIPNTKYSFSLVLNPKDDVIKNIKTIKNLPICQIMTIHPGRQGQPFIPQTLYKIEQLRINGYSGKIILDGGINNETLPLIMSQKFLPDAVCPGSYFHQNPKEKLDILNRIIQAEKYKDRI